MSVERKAFNFYLSFFALMKFLNANQVSDIVIAICKVQFLEIHIDDIDFEDEKTQLVWVAIKHSIKASIEGYCSKMSIDYDTTLGKGLPEVVGNKEKEKYKNKDNEKEKEENTSLPLLVPSKSESDALKVANYLLQKILEHKPNFKTPEISVWAKDIEKAINLDNRIIQELIACIDWIYSVNGSFWVPNILSAKKLREKFDIMEAQMMSNPKNKSRNKTAQALAKGGY
ncbi:MAG: hypothetical protein GQ531_04925 [Sulfurovum sp.]|nr:hypothetical protein [Sulfurovum sp.]